MNPLGGTTSAKLKEVDDAALALERIGILKMYIQHETDLNRFSSLDA